MIYKVVYRPPQWPLYRQVHGRLQLWHLEVETPLSRVFWVWEAPAHPEWPPLVRKAFLALLTEAQPQKVAALHALGFRAQSEAHLDGFITSIEGLTANLPRALALMHRFWTEVPLGEGALCPIKERLSMERQRAWANPAYRASAYLEKQLWGRAYAVSGTLSAEEITALSAQELSTFYENWLQKALRHIVVVGPFVPDAVRWAFSWQGELSYRLWAGNTSSDWLNEADEKAQQASVRVAYRGFRRAHPAYPLYRLALLRLGGYFGSRLMQAIRERGGYTYGIYARPMEALTGSYFVIESEIEKARAIEALTQIRQEVEAWAACPFETEADFAEARNYLLARLAPESAGQWGGIIASLLLHGHTPDSYIAQAQAISNLTLSSYEAWKGEAFQAPLGGVIIGAEAPIFAA